MACKVVCLSTEEGIDSEPECASHENFVIIRLKLNAKLQPALTSTEEVVISNT